VGAFESVIQKPDQIVFASQANDVGNDAGVA
jgi:hypothetical protein